MKRIAATIPDYVMAAVCATVAVVSIVPISVIAFIVLVIAVLARMRSRIRSCQDHLAMATCFATVSLFLGLVAASAIYRPAKTVEQLLDGEVALASTRMTLAELSYAASFDHRSFPIRISFCFADADREKVVAVPRRKVTLRELLDAIETQTVLRHRFMHCGNGYTILWGGDCSFGLSVRDPEMVAPPWPRERFDVDAYVSIRDRRAITP